MNKVTRFYDGKGDLTLGTVFDEDKATNEVERLFKEWIRSGMAPRDFHQYLDHAFYSIWMDYTICKGCGGLGGCRTLNEYMKGSD